MKKIPRAITCASLSIACAATSYAADERTWVRVDLSAWQAGLDGDVASGDQRLDTGSAGIDDEEIAQDLRIDFNIPIPLIPSVRLGWTSIDHDGSGESNSTGTFDDLPLVDGEPISTDMSMDDGWIELGMGFGLGPARITGGVVVHHYDTSVHVSVLGASAGYNESWWLPMLAVGATLGLPLNFSIEAFVHGLPLELEPVDKAEIFDGRIQARWTPLRPAGFGFGLLGGYRYAMHDIRDGEHLLDVKQDGFYLGLTGEW
jgi:hypothetical protein